jgi:hypothetical protein
MSAVSGPFRAVSEPVSEPDDERTTGAPSIAPPTRTESAASHSAAACEVCGADIATMRTGTKYCGSACRSRSYDQRTRRYPGTGPSPVKNYGTALVHPGYSVERCPRCDFPEADGGYCAACGWTLPRPGTPGGWPLHPAGTVHGPSINGAERHHPQRAAA